jgi:hypothetical protein
MEPLIGIYQPFYKTALIERLDFGFIALDWLSNPTPALRELALHHHIAVQNIYSRHRLTGLLSPKFFAKTKLRSQQVYDWIADNPGHEIYLINGLPYIPYANYNDIERSKINNHPAFESWTRTLCREIGLELPEQFPRQTHANLCACNYWIASPSFWEGWVKQVMAPIFEMIAVHKPTDEIFGYAKHRVRSPVYQLTFIYERLIDYYVAQNKIDAIYYPWTTQRVLSLDYHPSIAAFLEEMIPLVDRIDAAGQWSDRDKIWLRERYAAVRLGTSGDDMLTSDPADFDLPRSYPASSANNQTQ